MDGRDRGPIAIFRDKVRKLTLCHKNNHLHARECVAVSLQSQCGAETIASILIQPGLYENSHGGKMLHDTT